MALSKAAWAVCELALVAGQRAAHLLQLHGEAAGEVVAAALNRGFHLGRQVVDLVLVAGLFLFQQSHVRLDHGDALVHARHLVVHVADVLLQNQFRILAHGDKEPDERTDHAGQTSPHKKLPPLSRGYFSGWSHRRCVASRGRRSRGAAGRDGIVGHEIRYGVRDLLFLFLLLQAPGDRTAPSPWRPRRCWPGCGPGGPPRCGPFRPGSPDFPWSYGLRARSPSAPGRARRCRARGRASRRLR